jgi:hypothetical protein
MAEPYRVASPLASGTRDETRLTQEAAAPAELRPRAVFVAHGMGQQVPFETMDQVARGLCKEIERRGEKIEERAARTVRVGCETIQRLELDVRTATGETLRPIHLYEGYWAPLTEGVAGFRHVVRFLLQGAVNGLRSNARLHRFMFGKPRQFHINRWSLALLSAVVVTLIAVIIIGGTILGGGIMRLLVPRHELVNDDVLRELTALFELLLAVIAGAGAVAVVIIFAGRVLKRWPRVARIVSVMTVVPVFVIVMAVWMSAYIGIPVIVVFNETPLLYPRACEWCPFSLTIFGRGGAFVGDFLRTIVESLLRCRLRPPEFWLWFFLVGATVLLLVRSVWAVVAAWLRRRRRDEPHHDRDEPHRHQDEPHRDEGGLLTAVGLALIALAVVVALCGHGGALAFATWLLLFGAVLFVRSFLIQYIGDVAIYVSSHTVDRFFDLRNRIRGVVRRAARAVYASRDEHGALLYDGVVMVGHSLGSVVVYDGLNRLINEDDLSRGTPPGVPPVTCDGETLEDLQVAARTRLLLTFGSPLDKTAFVFAHFNLETGSERDALAASVQPLIARERPFHWINLWTPFDILGGHLDFYDTPRKDPSPNLERVLNLVDEDAMTPFAAHTEFWHNQLLYEKMYDALR